MLVRQTVHIEQGTRSHRNQQAVHIEQGSRSHRKQAKKLLDQPTRSHRLDVNRGRNSIRSHRRNVPCRSVHFVPLGSKQKRRKSLILQGLSWVGGRNRTRTSDPFAQSSLLALGAGSPLVSRQQTQGACLRHSPLGRRFLRLPRRCFTSRVHWFDVRGRAQ